MSGQVELWLEKFRHVVEVHVHARGGHMLKGRAVATSWDEALSQAVDRLVQQGQKLKGKWQERKREARPVKRAIPGPRRGGAGPPDRPGAALPGEADDARGGGARRCRRRRTRSWSSATPSTDAVSVVFRRKDGDIGLIEPKA